MTTDSAKRTGRKRGNNEGTIVQRTDGRWVAAATLPDGRRKWLYGKTRREVQDKLTATLRNVQQGLAVPTSRQTLGQFLDRWLTDCVQPTVRRSTYVSYEQYVRVHITPALGGVRLEQLTPQRVQAFLNDKLNAVTPDGRRRHAPRTVQYIRSVLRRALGQALKWGMVSRNVATLIDPPRVVQHEIEAITPERARAILDAFKGDSLEAFVTTTLLLALRRGEALGLRWGDVD